MTDRAQFEAMLEALINEDQESAKEIFHNIVVSKSREIYEELLAEDFTSEDENATSGQAGEETMGEMFGDDAEDDSEEPADDVEDDSEEGDDEEGDEDHAGEEGEDHDDHAGEGALDYDPHSWLSPLAFKAQVTVVMDALTIAFLTVKKSSKQTLRVTLQNCWVSTSHLMLPSEKLEFVWLEVMKRPLQRTTTRTPTSQYSTISNS